MSRPPATKDTASTPRRRKPQGGPGSLWGPEAVTFRDEATGASVRQVTTHRSIHHHPFYYVPAWDRNMRRLLFVSHRTGRPEVFAELHEDEGPRRGHLLQLTSHAGLAEWSVHPSHDGAFVYFTDNQGGWRVDCRTFREEQIMGFGARAVREPGMVGAAMGTTALSPDDRWWAVPVKVEGVARLLLVDTSTGDARVIVERDTIAHPQFHPGDPTWLRYAGPHTDRIWVLRRDGSDHCLAYRRDANARQWIVHEVWRPGTMEILAADWPRGVLAIDVLTGATRLVCRLNAWHPAVDPSGRFMVCDTTFPDRGLLRFDLPKQDVSPGTGLTRFATICLSRSSNVGNHWNTDHCPYDDGPVTVHAPQHTHPHPSISPDGKRVVFTSDRSGIAQIYEVFLPASG